MYTLTSKTKKALNKKIAIVRKKPEIGMNITKKVTMPIKLTFLNNLEYENNFFLPSLSKSNTVQHF